MPYHLPPLSTLRPFEAAGRHLSFKQAAEELNLTPSAISHALQTLEDWLGTPLFTRGHRSLALTPAGAAYLPEVRGMLERLAVATSALPGRAPSGRLAVSVAPTFGLRWLVPRLPRFRDQHPDITLTLDTSQRPADLPRDGVDVAIRMRQDDWRTDEGADLHAACLVQEALIPVCAPALAARVTTPADLESLPLLHVDSVTEEWAAWAMLTGVDLSTLTGGARFDTVHMALEAAASGLGVAMGRLPLVDTDLATGRLVAVLGPPRPIRTGYWLITSRAGRNRPEVAAFRAWIKAELAASPMM
ncbi:transcriptional regulator GcvA [Nitrospirillum viridazoti]|uniref:DNA-binding transcriptional LysR family regulator n=2 Tax=Nitrospirillum TaxID=1543705 RepID=A0A560IAN9_9PROT|nr:transcriptional regulator GcvA [Nitrospirillum amazonense]TWB56097.1 DNA-binding transcriptional LysR family regulator [Nitrospirillum amazonense]